jgi:hypothetical protein
MQINSAFSSVSGKIKILLMAVPDTGDVAHYERIRALLLDGPKSASLLVWCNNEWVREELAQWLAAQVGPSVSVQQHKVGEAMPMQARCVLLSPSAHSATPYSRWVRDPYLFRWADQGMVSILGSSAAKNEDGSWAQDYLSKLNVDGLDIFFSEQKTFPVAGGNILFDRDFVMVGARQFRAANAEIGPEQGKNNLLANLNGATSQFERVIEIGSHTAHEPQKLVHIDLYLSLTGCQQQSSGKYGVLVGHCVQVCGAAAPDPVLATTVARMNEYLDAVATTLEAENFAVLRNPIPVLQKENVNESYLCAYNNCLTEVAESGRKVWLASLTHGQESAEHHAQLLDLEHQNARIWESLGFEVKFVRADFHSILDDQGSLHCITNEFLRAPTDAFPQVDF